MAFVIEDGSGKTDATSYTSVAEADAYHVDYGDPSTWSLLTASQKQSALMEGTRYVDLVYGDRWRGLKTDEDQALDWPRAFVTDANYKSWGDDVIPQAIKNAVSVLALKAQDEALIEDLEDSGKIKSKSVRVGPVEEEIEFAGGGQDPAQAKRFRLVDLIVRDFLTTPPGADGFKTAPLVRT